VSVVQAAQVAFIHASCYPRLLDVVDSLPLCHVADAYLSM